MNKIRLIVLYLLLLTIVSVASSQDNSKNCATIKLIIGAGIEPPQYVFCNDEVISNISELVNGDFAEEQKEFGELKSTPDYQGIIVTVNASSLKGPKNYRIRNGKLKRGSKTFKDNGSNLELKLLEMCEAKTEISKSMNEVHNKEIIKEVIKRIKKQ